MARVHVTSEIGPLRAVLVHTPGRELVPVTPGNREDYLYDAIIDLELAQREHPPGRRHRSGEPNGRLLLSLRGSASRDPRSRVHHPRHEPGDERRGVSESWWRTLESSSPFSG